MATNGGSSTYRNIPDVALTADNIFVSYDNGDDSGTYYFMGTSCAAPLWAGFCALVNQQSTASNPTNSVGFLNPALYAIGTSAGYSSCFHDITTGNNIGTNTAGLFYATNGYDLCTGWGTPNGNESDQCSRAARRAGNFAGNGLYVQRAGGRPIQRDQPGFFPHEFQRNIIQLVARWHSRLAECFSDRWHTNAQRRHQRDREPEFRRQQSCLWNL